MYQTTFISYIQPIGTARIPMPRSYIRPYSLIRKWIVRFRLKIFQKYQIFLKGMMCQATDE